MDIITYFVYNKLLCCTDNCVFEIFFNLISRQEVFEQKYLYDSD